MSPVSRGRKGRKFRRSGQRVLRLVPPGPSDACDCPACTGEDFDPQDMIDDLVRGGAELLDADDPLDAELFGAAFLAAGRLAGDGFADALTDGIVPMVAAQAGPASLAVLLTLGALDDGAAAAKAAAGLAGAGVPVPAWASELREAVRAGPGRRFADPDDTISMLVCSFDRSGRSHGFVVQVDHTDCHAAANILLFPAEMGDEVLGAIRKDAGGSGLSLVEEELDPAELRWQIERALDAREVHDTDLGPAAIDEDSGDEDLPGYHQLSVLLRARMQALPEPSRPPATHGDGGLSLLPPSGLGGPRRRVAAAPKLPPKRKKSGPAAPIYQIKVTLSGTKPSIWRRLEVPADIGLAKLHGIIQVAFGWEDAHLHVFETAYGSFGVADRELGHRAEAPVTLEQVAHTEGEKLRYTYDFGDDWTHEIVVEKVLDRGTGPYPRCTGGRRAAPPEDCGGVWGYADLIEVLADPRHPEHADRLEWLGLESAAGFQPARFDATAITRRLTSRSR